MEAPAEPRQLPAGTMLDEKYRIERLIAVGGMGAVYEGTHIKLRKRVAIKILNPQLSSAPMIERFHREAITASQIGHEGIAQVTDIGTSSAGEPFLVMEYLEGESLASRLRASGPLPVETACELACAILSPLEAAHRAGIVHRDLKPDNVFLVRQSRGELVKLLDFGISRAAGLEQEFRLTTTGLILGTPYYMSPEQARGDSQVGTGADLYALGVILYEMLLGHVPIHGDNYNQLMYRVMIGDFVPPRGERPDIPEALEHVILRAMATEPTHRPQTAVELEHALLPFCRATFRQGSSERISAAGISFTTPPPHVRTGAGQPMAPTGTDRTILATPTPVPAQPPAKRSRSGLVIGAVVLVLAGGGAAAFAVLGGGGDDKKPASEPTAAVAPTTAPPTPPPPPDPGVAANPSPTPPAPPPPAPPAPPAEPATVTLRFAIDPPTATITLDGAPVKGTEITVPKDGATHALHIAAPDRIARDEKIRFDESQRFGVELKRAPRTGRPPPKDHKDHDRIDSESPY